MWGSRPGAPATVSDVEAEVREMFATYAESEAPDYGAAATRKHNRYD